MRCLSEDMRILLQGRNWKAQPGDAPRSMVLQETSLVGLEQEPFDTFTGQKEQPPVRMFDQLRSRGLMLLQVKRHVGESFDGQESRCDPLMNRPLEDSEVPQG